MTLQQKLNELKNSKLKSVVDNKIAELENIGVSSNEIIFQELCFCILTANFNAKKSIEIQNKINSGFIKLSEIELAKKLAELGHRFPNNRANYIVQARSFIPNLKTIITQVDAREYIAKNIKGLGFKEASHFLRNVGRKDVSIIDFHIVDILVENKLIERPKTLTKNKYLEIENTLKTIAKDTNMNLSELDFYLWYLETGTILK